MSRMQFSKYETIQSFIYGKYANESWNPSNPVQVHYGFDFKHLLGSCHEFFLIEWLIYVCVNVLRKTYLKIKK